MTRALSWILVGVLATVATVIWFRRDRGIDPREELREARADSLIAEVDSLQRVLDVRDALVGTLQGELAAAAARDDSIRARAAVIVEEEAAVAVQAGAELSATLDSIRSPAPETIPLVDVAEQQASTRDRARLAAIAALETRVDAEGARRAAAELLVRALEDRTVTSDRRTAALEEAVRVETERREFWQEQSPTWFQRNWKWLAAGVGIVSGFL